MSTFDDRERGQEKKFQLDQDKLFRATMRRNKLLGMWAADLLGLAGTDAEEYAKTVVMADLEEPGDDDVIRKVLADFDSKGVAKTKSDIADQLVELMPIAVEQIQTEAG